MILRIFRVVTEPGKRKTFETFFRETAVPLMRGTDGVEHVHFGLPRPETPDEFCIAMVWRDVDALRAFVGDDWRTPHIHPDEAGIVKDRFLHHYDVLPA
jgi:heme-degrading monooxygenase HmoA